MRKLAQDGADAQVDRHVLGAAVRDVGDERVDGSQRRLGEHDDELMSVRFPTTPNATECKLTPRVSEVHVYQKAQ